MAFVIIINIIAIAASASLGDGNELSADIDLQVGTFSAGVFTPFTTTAGSPGQTLNTGDVITVRICPKSDFYCGASRYIVMFDKNYFQIVGANKDAFIPNTANTFYAGVAPAVNGWGGTTNFPSSAAWPAALVTEGAFDIYTAVLVYNNVVGTANAKLLPGDWLFQFNLTVKKTITAGNDARILMDSRWFRNTTYVSGQAYFNKCTGADQACSTGTSKYDFNIDLAGADLHLPLAKRSTITFVTNSGSTISPVNNIVGTPVSAPTPEPVLTGYTFAGWYTDIGLTQPVNWTGYTLGENDATLYAKWNINQYSVIFDSAEGLPVETITQNYNTPVTEPVTTKTGYTFNRWSPEVPDIMPANDTNCRAIWTANTYTVEYNGNGSDSGSMDKSYFTYDVRDNLGVNKFTKIGNELLGWSTSPSATTAEYTDEVSVVNLTPTQGATVTLYAVWGLKSFNYIFDDDNGEGGTIGELTYGTPVVAPEVRKLNWFFTGWDQEVPATMPAEDLVRKALYTPVSLKITTGNVEDIGEEYIVLVPWYKMYSMATLQLGYTTVRGNGYKVEYKIVRKATAAPAEETAEASKYVENVFVDQNGKITNSGFLGRKAIVEVNIYDNNNNIIATKTATVIFKKEALEKFLPKLQNFITKLMPIINTIMSWFKKA